MEEKCYYEVILEVIQISKRDFRKVLRKNAHDLDDTFDSIYNSQVTHDAKICTVCHTKKDAMQEYEILKKAHGDFDYTHICESSEYGYIDIPYIYCEKFSPDDTLLDVIAWAKSSDMIKDRSEV